MEAEKRDSSKLQVCMSPETDKPSSRMAYVSNTESLRRELDGHGLAVDGSDASDISEEEVQKTISSQKVMHPLGERIMNRNAKRH